MEKKIIGRIEEVETPFLVEFARSSRTRDGAPTLIPVTMGGCRVRAVILILNPEVSVESAMDLLWRRETRKGDRTIRYQARTDPGPNHVVVEHLSNFSGLKTVLYTSIGANIPKNTPECLARLAIESAKGNAGATKMDGINYLLSVKRHGVKTPLLPAYEVKILELSKADSLEKAFEKIRSKNANS